MSNSVMSQTTITNKSGINQIFQMSTLISLAVVLGELVLLVACHKELSDNVKARQYSYYCNHKCFDVDTQIYNEHVACTYYPCLPSYRCGVKHKRLPLTEDEKTFVLHLHNSYRDFVASGNERRGENCKASDMSVLSYDKESEFLAACWANQCKESPIPALGRDACRATELSSHNGQNHWAFASEDYNIDWSDKVFLQEAVEFWYEQLRNSSGLVIDSYTTEGSRYFEFFTQVVWSSTYLLGCGRTMFSVDRFVGINIVCNYSPGGNLPNHAVYSRGAPCTKYENMTRNDKYSSLCGQIRPDSQDRYVLPFVLKSSRTGGIPILVTLGILFEFLLFMG